MVRWHNSLKRTGLEKDWMWQGHGGDTTSALGDMKLGDTICVCVVAQLEGGGAFSFGRWHARAHPFRAIPDVGKQIRDVHGSGATLPCKR